MRKFYVTGVSGAGKSTLCLELNKRGIKSTDVSIANSDLDCYWRNKLTKQRVRYQPGASEEWYKNHERICDVDVLENYLISNPDVQVVTGISFNQDEYLHLFDKIFLLQCREETFLNRLQNRETNPFGRTETEQKFVKDNRKGFEEKILQKGAIPISTDKPLDEVVDEIIKNIKS